MSEKLQLPDRPGVCSEQPQDLAEPGVRSDILRASVICTW